MPTTETGNGVMSQYVPFTPFQESYAFVAEPATPSFEFPEVAPAVTPFVSEYGGVETPTREAGELHDLLFELYDSEFDEVLADLAHEAWEAVMQRAEPLGETGSAASAERFLEEWAAPVRREAETMLENIAQAVGEHDLASMSEAEVDSFFEQFEPRGTGLEPHFENFLGGLWRKAKSLANKAIDVAKKGIMLIPGLSGLISRLKALVAPMLRRVLQSATDRLPPALQPYARQLAQRVLGTIGAEVEEAEAFESAPASSDMSAVQQQFDLEAASLMFARDETEQEVIAGEAAYGAEREAGASVAELQEARAQFIDELERGVDPQQALEQFIPAIMAVLPIARTVIGIIGRRRVVNYLAGYLSGMVAKYVPREVASQLSQSIVDAGMRMLSLETPIDTGPRLAHETIAQTVEDTVRRVAEHDETTFEDQTLLEAAVMEAFHDAAAENFPSEVIVPELHEAPVRATWVAFPPGPRRKFYKKYTHVFEVEITPQVAASVTTFGGTTLAAVLRDQLGVVPPVRARVHVYQAISGTTLPRIAYFERRVPGLGGMRPRVAATQLHPLTVQAATAILHHPRLGRDVAGQFLSSRELTTLGQRFYYLEIAGARPIAVTGGLALRSTAVRRTSQVNVTLDFPKDEFRVFVYLSEAEAQEVAAKIRQHDVAAVVVLAKRVYEAGVNVALGGDIRRHVKILTEAMPQEQFLGLDLRFIADRVKRRLAKKVVEWVDIALSAYLKGSVGEFVAAADDPADGVTIVVRIMHPPGASLVRRLLRGDVGIATIKDAVKAFEGSPSYDVKTVAGFRFD